MFTGSPTSTKIAKCMHKLDSHAGAKHEQANRNNTWKPDVTMVLTVHWNQTKEGTWIQMHLQFGFYLLPMLSEKAYQHTRKLIAVI